MLRRSYASFIVIMLVLSSISFLSAGVAGEKSFSDNVLVSGSDHPFIEQRDPSIAVGPNGTIYVVWEEYDNHGIPQLMFAISQDEGESFSNATQVAPDGGEQGEPSIAVNDNGTVFVVWTDQSAGPGVMVSKDLEGNGNFSTPVEVWSTTSGQVHPDIAVDGDLLVITWAQENGSFLDIMSARSPDGGETFLPAVKVDDGEGSEVRNFPSVAVMGDDVFVAWHDGSSDPFLDIFGAWSNDSGASFTSPVTVSDGAVGQRQSLPDVAFMPDGNVTVAWQDESSGDLDIRNVVSSGTTFPSSVPVNVELVGDQSYPAVAVDPSGNISVVFRDESSGAPHITWAVSRDEGASFSTGVRVDDRGEMAVQGAPDVAIGNGTPMIVFEDLEGEDWDIYFSKMLNSPPMVTITSPSDGAVVDDTIQIEGEATDPDDNDTLLEVEVRIRGLVENTGWMGATGGANWSLEFNISLLLNGEYWVEARSYDGRAYSAVDSITISVENEIQMYPDLAFEGNITFNPTQLEMMRPVIIRVEVTNLGNVSAHDIHVEFRRGTVSIGEESISVLEPDETGTAFISWMALEGIHTIRAVIDPDDLIKELDEGNNLISEQVEVMPAGYYSPDLFLNSSDMVISPNDLSEGDVATINVTVGNDGRVNASSVKVILTLDGEEVANTTLDSVPVNQTAEAQFEWVALLGDHVLGVVVDPSNSTGELDEGNNNASVHVEVEMAYVAGDSGEIYIIIGVVAAFLAAVMAVTLVKRRR